MLRMRESDSLDQCLRVGASGGGFGFGAGVGQGKCRQDSEKNFGQLHFVFCLLFFGLFLEVLGDDCLRVVARLPTRIRDKRARVDRYRVIDSIQNGQKA